MDTLLLFKLIWKRFTYFESAKLRLANVDIRVSKSNISQIINPAVKAVNHIILIILKMFVLRKLLKSKWEHFRRIPTQICPHVSVHHNPQGPWLNKTWLNVVFLKTKTFFLFLWVCHMSNLELSWHRDCRDELVM